MSQGLGYFRTNKCLVLETFPLILLLSQCIVGNSPFTLFLQKNPYSTFCEFFPLTQKDLNTLLQ